MGKYASEPLGDYVADQTTFCRLAGLHAFLLRSAFMISSSELHSSIFKDALEADVEAITTLAREEGLEAHARAVESRFGKEDFDEKSKYQTNNERNDD